MNTMTGANATGYSAGFYCGLRRACLGLLLALVSLGAGSDDLKLPAPGPKDTCPVCGMFVSRYPDWVATVLYRDGHAHHFDGPKDLFKYLLDLDKYAPGHHRSDITAIGVTEYYGLTRIDAQAAWYVIGSDVVGPMGHELIPLRTHAEAEEFQRDHEGKRLLRFDEVTRPLLLRLDQGRFE